VPNSTPEGQITLSVLDRLIDEDPKRSAEVPLTRAQALREMKAALRRDLEWLLNSRCLETEIQKGTSELARSVFCYGLPDYSSLSQDQHDTAHELARRIERVLAVFEPRLAGAKVTLPKVDEEKTRGLRFVITGMLRVDPRPERVSFDTMLEISSGEYQVKGDAGGR
jgi:type VI secretion system protein ImpF